MDAGQAFLLIETAATTFMAGALWTMQILNYPLLALVGDDALAKYEAAHNRRFGLVVIPGVLVATAASVGLLVSRPRTVPVWGPICELALVVMVIASTAAFQGRYHGALARGSDARTHQALVRTNWLRVAAWSAAGLIALWMCHLTFVL